MRFVTNAQPYTVSSLMYITLFKLMKKYFRRSKTRKKKNRQYIYCRKYKTLRSIFILRAHWK